MTLRQRIDQFLDRPAVRNAIIGVILFNAVILGVETSDSVMAEFGPLILMLIYSFKQRGVYGGVVDGYTIEH